MKDYEERLEYLRNLKEGWYDGSGEPISEIAINMVKEFFELDIPNVKYSIFPTTSGGILIEFTSNGWDRSIGFNPDGGIEIYGIQINDIGEIFKNLARNQEPLGEEFARVLYDNAWDLYKET